MALRLPPHSRIYNRILNYNHIQAQYLAGGQPRLSVSVRGTSITLSWPVGALGFNLYSAGALDDSSWNPVGGIPTVSADGATQSITVTLTATNKFYGLQKP